MARPSLPVGTAGQIHYVKCRTGWTARCEFRDYDGVTRTVERTREKKTVARNALIEAIRDRSHYNRDAAISPDAKLSLIAEAWWKFYVAQAGSLGSKSNYRLQLDAHILPGVGNLSAREFSVGSAERFLRVVEQKYGRNTTKLVRTVLSNVCAFAARMDAMPRNPVRDTTPISVKPSKDPKALKSSELRQLRAFVTYHPRSVRRNVPELIDFLAATGERLGECLAVTLDAMDIDKRLVEVRGTMVNIKGIGVALQRRPKTPAGYRTLTLPEWVVPSVERQIFGTKEMRVRVLKVNDFTELLLAPRVSTSGRRRTANPPDHIRDLIEDQEVVTENVSMLFPSSVGTFWDTANAVHDVKQAFTFAGLKDESSHLLRKTVATQMDDAGVPVRVIADQLGHSRTSMTQDVYFGRTKNVDAGGRALDSFGFDS